jgi:hypothetical protein
MLQPVQFWTVYRGRPGYHGARQTDQVEPKASLSDRYEPDSSDGARGSGGGHVCLMDMGVIPLAPPSRLDAPMSQEGLG